MAKAPKIETPAEVETAPVVETPAPELNIVEPIVEPVVETTPPEPVVEAEPELIVEPIVEVPTEAVEMAAIFTPHEPTPMHVVSHNGVGF